MVAEGSQIDLYYPSTAGYEVQGPLLSYEVCGLPRLDEETSAVPQNLAVGIDLNEGRMEDRGAEVDADEAMQYTDISDEILYVLYASSIPRTNSLAL